MASYDARQQIWAWPELEAPKCRGNAQQHRRSHANEQQLVLAFVSPRWHAGANHDGWHRSPDFEIEERRHPNNCFAKARSFSKGLVVGNSFISGPNPTDLFASSAVAIQHVCVKLDSGAAAESAEKWKFDKTQQNASAHHLSWSAQGPGLIKMFWIRKWIWSGNYDEALASKPRKSC